MKSKAILVVALFLSCSVAMFGQGGEGRGGGQGRGGGGGRGGQQDQPPATDKVTPEIPGVVKAGTKVEIVKFGIRGSDAGMGMRDGSVLVSANGGVAKIDADGNMTTLVENSEQ